MTGNLKTEEKKSIMLTEFESKEMLRKAGIPVVPTKLARTRVEAINIAKEMGFPVGMKIASPDVVHKTDAGGVKLNLATAAQVGKAHTEMMAAIKKKFPKARIEGVTIQKMAKPGTEIIIGMSKDPQFGPVIMFGLGGILVEILKDVSFRIVPLEPKDAAEMIREIKGLPLLQGYRGAEPASLPAIEKLILKVSEFVEKNPNIKELDLNPVFAYKTSVLAVDARIALEPANNHLS